MMDATKKCMSNLEIVTQAIARHAGGWRDYGNTDKCECFGCGHKPQLGEYHGKHVAMDVLSSLGLDA